MSSEEKQRPFRNFGEKATILETDRFILPDAQIGTVKLRVKRKGDLTSEVKASTDGVCAWVNRVWCLVGCGWTFKCFFSALLDEFDEWTPRERHKMGVWNEEHIYIYLYTQIHIYRYTCILIRTYTHTLIHIHIYTYTSVLMHMYDTYMYAYIYIYIHRYTYT